MILRAYEEWSSLRGLSRTFGVSRNTVGAWLKKSPDLPPLQQTLAPRAPDEVLELDELWMFVGHRRREVLCFGWPCADARARLSPAPWGRAVTPRPSCFGAASRLLTVKATVHRSFGKLSQRPVHHSTSGCVFQRSHQPRRAFQQHATPASGTPRAKNPLLLQCPIMHELVIHLFSHRHNLERLQAIKIIN